MKSPKSLPASLLVLAAASLFGPAIGHSQTVSPVPAPTIITSAPYTISSSGYYQLGANLNVSNTSGNIITINAPNVTLDLAGHYISGPSPSPADTTLNGVYAYEQANIVVQNGTISHCQSGVLLSGNAQSTTMNLNGIVQNILANHCTYCGVYLIGAVNATVTQNRVTNTGGGNSSSHAGFAVGVYVSGSGVGNTVSNNTIANVASTGGYGSYGMYGDSATYAATGNTISNITAPNGSSSSGATYAIYVASFAVNNLISTSQYGLYDCTKYKDNLTSGVTTPFSGGTSVGYNN